MRRLQGSYREFSKLKMMQMFHRLILGSGFCSGEEKKDPLYQERGVSTS